MSSSFLPPIRNPSPQCKRTPTSQPRHPPPLPLYPYVCTQEDVGLKRGRPLQLSTPMYSQLSSLWAAAALDWDTVVLQRAVLFTEAGPGEVAGGALAAAATGDAEAVLAQAELELLMALPEAEDMG
jgi:hypothetical protein